MRNRFYFALIAILIFSGCKENSPDSSDSNILQKKSVMQPDTFALTTLDTSIFLTGFHDTIIDTSILSQKEAEDFLYKYFESKGVKKKSDIVISSLNDADKTCVTYDTIYNIETSKFSGAVISYWLGPCDLNGHCFLPSKAIIVATKNGYFISNEDFISTNFSIDSTVKSAIYGTDYDCGGRGDVRHFKVTLLD